MRDAHELTWLPDFGEPLQVALAALGESVRAGDFPLHILCYYKETNEVHQSMDAFTADFNPLLIAVCEDVPAPSAANTLAQYFVGPPLGPGLNMGTHARSGAPFILYKKTPLEPRGKRFSHRLGAEIAKGILGPELEGHYCLFQDADTASNPEALRSMVRVARAKGTDMIGASMTCVNASPVTSIGAFVSMTELLAVSSRLSETLILNRTRVISGSYVLIRLTAYLEFATQLCRPDSNMGMFERAAYATEDTLLTYMFSGAGYTSDIVLDEVAWNLPVTYEELLKQRRRWFNGELSTCLVAKRLGLVTPKLSSILFYLWAMFILVQGTIFWPNVYLLAGVGFYQQGQSLLILPAAAIIMLKLLVSISLFRRAPDGLESYVRSLAHLYCAAHLSFAALIFYYFPTSALITTAALAAFQLTVLMRGGLGRKLFVLISYWLHSLYATGVTLFLSDYSLANLSDSTWGVRETANDRSRYGLTPAQQAFARRERSMHIGTMVVCQVVAPLALVALSLYSPTAWSIVTGLMSVMAVVAFLGLCVRAFIQHSRVEVLVAEPPYQLKDRLIYSPRAGAAVHQQDTFDRIGRYASLYPRETGTTHLKQDNTQLKLAGGIVRSALARGAEETSHALRGQGMSIERAAELFGEWDSRNGIYRVERNTHQVNQR